MHKINILPTKACGDPEIKKSLTDFGFKIGTEVGGASYLTQVELPKGWTEVHPSQYGTTLQHGGRKVYLSASF